MLFPDENPAKKSQGEFQRLATVKYVDTSKRFQLKDKRDYSKQYAHIYSNRLNIMRPLIAQKATEKWGEYQTK